MKLPVMRIPNVFWLMILPLFIFILSIVDTKGKAKHEAQKRIFRNLLSTNQVINNPKASNFWKVYPSKIKIIIRSQFMGA